MRGKKLKWKFAFFQVLNRATLCGSKGAPGGGRRANRRSQKKRFDEGRPHRRGSDYIADFFIRGGLVLAGAGTLKIRFDGRRSAPGRKCLAREGRMRSAIGNRRGWYCFYSSRLNDGLRPRGAVNADFKSGNVLSGRQFQGNPAKP